MDKEQKRKLAHRVINIYQVEMGQLKQKSELVTEAPQETEPLGKSQPKIKVQNENVLIRVQKIPDKVKTGVMSFADPLVAGGNFQKGVDAQEQSLCRNTFLYPELKKFRRKYYYYNAKHPDDYYYEPRLIYSSRVKVLGNGQQPDLLTHFKYVDIVSVAAPDQRKMFHAGIQPDKQKLAANIREKILWTLREFKQHQVKVVLLGGFGCGEFRNDPRQVAEIFHEVLHRKEFLGAFDEVYFDILNDEPVCNEFRQVFEHKVI